MNQDTSQLLDNEELNAQYKKHLPRIKDSQLKIKKDQSLHDLSFTLHYKLNALYITNCHQVSFQHAFSQTCCILYATKSKIKNLTGIDQNQQLKELFLSNNLIEDLTPLQTLTQLNSLSVGYNKIGDISGLNRLINLKSLYLYNNNIENLIQIKNLQNLEILSINDNKLTSFYGIQFLTHLKDIYAENNTITDLYGIQQLNDLHQLYLNKNQISDLSPLCGCSSLETLQVSNNIITDISPLQHNTQLKYLSANDNYVNNFKVLNQLQSINPIFQYLGNQKEPNPLQINISNRSKSIFATRTSLEDIQQKQHFISQLYYSSLIKVKFQMNTMTINQLNLSNSLLVFTSAEQVSQ
ncbi:leucine-rich_repeat domain-containing protein [Hexamita inflata]|uniref:Leucine-rich repeat domain-containing protein n=1 Tax=Hexamita inflata TaxID=28002 RepID=A0AA86PJS5_9EUKA|nr:leucine-rich repeat domain-containing protein [Hexamita inflata]CAI9959762.1 leucine-rich repeat domain-containing protein [Hexamita inflata]